MNMIYENRLLLRWLSLFLICVCMTIILILLLLLLVYHKIHKMIHMFTWNTRFKNTSCCFNKFISTIFPPSRFSPRHACGSQSRADLDRHSPSSPLPQLIKLICVIPWDSLSGSKCFILIFQLKTFVGKIKQVGSYGIWRTDMNQ